MKRSDPRIRALEICLTQMQQGASLEQVLEVYPHWAADLRPLLEAAQASRHLGQSIHTPAGAIARSRSAMLQAARLAAQVPVAPRSSALPTWMARRSVQPRPASAVHSVLRLALTILLLVVFIGGGTTLVASAQSLPGDTLYPLKLSTERLRLFIARQPQQRLDLERQFDEQRMAELQALQQRSSQTGALPESLLNFAGPLVALNLSEWQVGWVRVLLDDQTQIIGEIRQGVVVDVQGLLQSDASVLARRIQARQFDISGRLQSITTEGWLVDGILVTLNESTLYQGQVGVGSRLSISAFILADGRLLARLVQVLDNPSAPQPTLLFNQPVGSPDDDDLGEPGEVEHDTTRTPEPGDDGDDSGRTLEPDDDDDPTRTPEPDDDNDPTRTPEPDDDEPTRTPEPDDDDPTRTPEPDDDDEPTRTPEPDDNDGSAYVPEPQDGDDLIHMPESDALETPSLVSG